MKPNRTMSFLLFALIVSNIAGCKKEVIDNTDYKPLFQNTFWVAEFHNKDKQPQPASLRFLEDGQVLWNDIFLKTNGNWKLEKNLITITLRNGSVFKAKLNPNKTMSDIKNDTANAINLTSGELNPIHEAYVMNSQWTMPNFLLDFKTNTYATAAFGTPGVGGYVIYNLAYEKEGPVITFTNFRFKYFIVMTSETKMNGVNFWPGDPKMYTFEVKKK